MELKSISESLNLRELFSSKENGPEELRKKERIKELEAIDQRVRQHEASHKAAGGNYAGAPTYSYTLGPDGKRYAIGGEVAIDVTPEKEPEGTISKMKSVIRAALSPADPSTQDLSVAVQATQLMTKAQREASDSVGTIIDKML